MRWMLLTGCLLFAVPGLAQEKSTETAIAADSKTAELDAYIAKAMHDWNLPGLSIAVVKDGQSV
ncbi:MAG: hypothetical protein WAS23_00355 [Dokdonella sp.]